MDQLETVDMTTTGEIVELGCVHPAAMIPPPLAADDLQNAGSDARNTQLSKREHEIFLAMCEGLQPAQISTRYRLSVKTISTYRARILEKTGCKNNVQLGVWAERVGLLETLPVGGIWSPHVDL